MTTIPTVVPPRPHAGTWNRQHPPARALQWLAGGWQDLWNSPGPSLAYGALASVMSATIVGGLFAFGREYLLFPALAGFMVAGPVLAAGLYEKSRRLASGEPVALARMILVRPASGGQMLFAGALLCLLALLWLRAAVIVYALFFGLRPFPDLPFIVAMMFTTPAGAVLLAVGTAVGALFAAFAFAIGAFSIPMLLEQRVDALTAMAASMALVWNNLPVMLAWGAIVLVLFMVSVATGLLGLVLAFPVLGYGTWHAYRTLQPAAAGPPA